MQLIQHQLKNNNTEGSSCFKSSKYYSISSKCSFCRNVFVCCVEKELWPVRVGDRDTRLGRTILNLLHKPYQYYETANLLCLVQGYLRLYGCGESTRRLTGLILPFPGLRLAFSSGETGRLDGRTMSSTILCGEFETKISGFNVME